MDVLLRKGKGRKKVLVRCWGTPVPWLWNLASFMRDVVFFHVEQGEVGIDCIDGSMGRFWAVHRMVGKPKSPFLEWAKEGSDCLVVDREGRVWELRYVLGPEGEVYRVCRNRIKDLGEFRRLARRMLAEAPSSM